MAALFPIVLEVEEIAVGTVLKTLHNTPGVVRFHIDMDALDKKVQKRVKEVNGAPRNFTRKQVEPGGPRAPDLVTLYLLQHGPTRLNVLANHLVENGYAAASISSTVDALRKKGITESGGVGIHRLTAAAEAKLREQTQKALPAPDSKAPKKKRGAETAHDFLLRKIAEAGGKISRLAARDLMEPAGFSPVGVDGALHKLKQKEFVRLKSPGEYEITAKGTKHHQQAAKPKE